MKLIKLNTDHYIIVDDSEIKEGDWFFANQGLRKCIRVDDKTSCPYITLNEKGEEIGHFHTWKGIVTHSTQPLESMNHGNYSSNVYLDIEKLSLQEVKELIGEVDVEKKAFNYTSSSQAHRRGFIDGYNQALEDNKEKKYTRNEVHALMCKAFIQGWKKADVVEAGLEGLKTDIECVWILTKHDSTSKTEWEVEFIDGKLKLK